MKSKAKKAIPVFNAGVAFWVQKTVNNQVITLIIK